MAAPIAQLSVQLAADVARLQQDLNKGRAEFRKFSRSVQGDVGGIKNSLSTVGSFAKGFIGALSVGAIVSFGKAVIDRASDLADLSQQLGISTDALQALQFAAAQSGVEAGALQTGLERLLRTMGDAADGNKTAIESFDRLGVKLLDASGNLRSTEAVFNDVQRALQEIDNPAQRASAAVDMFGKQGGKLNNILDGSAGSIQDMTAAAREAGAILGRPTVDELRKAGDQIDVLTKQVQVLAGELVAAAFNAENEFIPTFHSMANELQTIAEKAELAWNWVKRFRSEPIDRLLRGLAPPSPGLGGVPDFPPASLPKPPGVSNPLAISTAKTKEYTSAVQELLDKLQQQAKESGLLGDALLQEQARFEANAAALEDYEHKLSTSTTASAALIEQVYELKKAHEANEAAVAHNKQTMEEFTERIKKEQEELEKSNDLLKDLATDISGTLASGLIDAALHADNLGEAFQGLAESIAEAALQALLFKAITTGIDAIFAPSASQTFFTDATAGKAMLPGLFHGGGIVGEGGPTRSVPAAAFAGAPRFHSGGGFGPGEHPAILKAGEGVFTPGQMAAMGGGEGVTVQVINNTGQPVRQERGRGPDGQELLRIIVGQLASDVRNRGQLGQAIEGTFGLGRSPASR